MQFMQQTGGVVSQDEFKQVTEDLRNKKEEVFMLQHEVKDLSEQIASLKIDNANAQELIKTEYEIKILELEQRLGGDNEAAAEIAAQKVSQSYQA